MVQDCRAHQHPRWPQVMLSTSHISSTTALPKPSPTTCYKIGSLYPGPAFFLHSGSKRSCWELGISHLPGPLFQLCCGYRAVATCLGWEDSQRRNHDRPSLHEYEIEPINVCRTDNMVKNRFLSDLKGSLFHARMLALNAHKAGKATIDHRHTLLNYSNRLPPCRTGSMPAPQL